MGSPVSPIVANLYMEDFEERALSTAPHPPGKWLRYVDDTFVIIEEQYISEFHQHINQIDPHIKFTIEEEKNNSLPFLDVLITRSDEGKLSTNIYRKATHTNQYLNFTSNHHLQHKRSVVRSLLHRANEIISNEEEKQKEIKNIQQVLKANAYKPWMMKIPEKKPKTTTSTNATDNPNNNHINNNAPTRRPRSVQIPYVKGISEKLQATFKKYNIATIHKPYNKIRDFLVHPKDPTPDLEKCGIIYHINCTKCQDTYIGESGRQLAIRMKEHVTKSNSAIYEHCRKNKGHSINPDKVEILCREDHKELRKIKESIHIRQYDPSLNRDQGQKLPKIFNPLLPCRRGTHDESCDTLSHDS